MFRLQLLGAYPGRLGPTFGNSGCPAPKKSRGHQGQVVLLPDFTSRSWLLGSPRERCLCPGRTTPPTVSSGVVRARPAFGATEAATLAAGAAAGGAAAAAMVVAGRRRGERGELWRSGCDGAGIAPEGGSVRGGPGLGRGRRPGRRRSRLRVAAAPSLGRVVVAWRGRGRRCRRGQRSRCAAAVTVFVAGMPSPRSRPWPSSGPWPCSRSLPASWPR